VQEWTPVVLEPRLSEKRGAEELLQIVTEECAVDVSSGSRWENAAGLCAALETVNSFALRSSDTVLQELISNPFCKFLCE
jgi:hypothetical protein